MVKEAQTEAVVDEFVVSREDAEQHMANAKVARYEEQKAEGVINPIVLAQCLDIRPQMIYNYIGKGKIKAAENSTGKKVIAFEDGVTFAQMYLDRKVKADMKVKAELAGATS
jgi:hypothetical protein